MSHDTTCIPELRITLPAHPDSLALLRHVVRGFRDAYAIPAATMDDIVLAVSEAAANAAVHAYDRRGAMTLVARMEDDRLHILLRDHGRGIDPSAVTPMLGHGLSLMTHVAETIDVTGSSAGTDVVMTFGLDDDHDRSSMTDDFGAVS